MFCHRPAPEIFQGRAQLDQCGQWAYRLSEPNRKTPTTRRTCIMFSSAAIAGKQMENTERETESRDERSLSEEGRRKI